MAYEGNKDINQAIASLEVLKEIQKDLSVNRAEQDSAQKIFSVFKGNQLPCDKDLLNFNDCCQKMSGWGNSLGLTKLRSG
jgi:conjugal transfer mating pair stabilization protein TraN